MCCCDRKPSSSSEPDEFLLVQTPQDRRMFGGGGGGVSLPPTAPGVVPLPGTQPFSGHTSRGAGVVSHVASPSLQALSSNIFSCASNTCTSMHWYQICSVSGDGIIRKLSNIIATHPFTLLLLAHIQYMQRIFRYCPIATTPD